MSVDEDSWQPNSAGEYLAVLAEYQNAVLQLLPALPQSTVSLLSISPVDALALGYFLQHPTYSTIVLDTGAFLGASAFFFASHSNVSRVVGVSRNPTLAELVGAAPDIQGKEVGIESLQDVRAFDVTRAAFDKLDHEDRKKVEVREAKADDAWAESLTTDAEQGAGPVVFVGGLSTREDVRVHLEEVFEQNPHAMFFLDNCRYDLGPFVQAGVADFIEQAADEYRFQLIGDLGPGPASSSLGVLYPGSSAAQVEKCLATVKRAFSERLDPLRLLNREEELIAAVGKANQELAQVRRNSQGKAGGGSSQGKGNNDQLRKRVSRLERRNNQLIAHYASRRYRLADGLANGVLSIPVVGGILRRRKQPPPQSG